MLYVIHPAKILRGRLMLRGLLPKTPKAPPKEIAGEPWRAKKTEKNEKERNRNATPTMPVTLDEDAIDEILYLARANETTELDEFLFGLTTQTQHSKAGLIAAATDPHSKNSALHYAAANGHIGISLHNRGFG